MVSAACRREVVLSSFFGVWQPVPTNNSPLLPFIASICSKQLNVHRSHNHPKGSAPLLRFHKVWRRDEFWSRNPATRGRSNSLASQSVDLFRSFHGARRSQKAVHGFICQMPDLSPPLPTIGHVRNPWPLLSSTFPSFIIKSSEWEQQQRGAFYLSIKAT